MGVPLCDYVIRYMDFWELRIMDWFDIDMRFGEFGALLDR